MSGDHLGSRTGAGAVRFRAALGRILGRALPFAAGSGGTGAGESGADRLRRERPEGGFGLIEVMIAFSILMLALVPVAALLTNVINQAANARERLTALSLAEQYIESLNNSGPHLNAGNQPIIGTSVLETATPIVRSSVAYKVYSDFTWTAAEGTNPDLCTSGSAPKVLNLQVTVDWGANSSLTDTTVLDYPPAGIPTYGFLAVRVNGDPAGSSPNDVNNNTWANRVHAVPVTIVSPPAPAVSTFSATVYPDSYGCVFQQVPPGTYGIALADPSPGVPGGVVGTYGSPSFVANFNEQTSQTQAPFTVSVGQVTPVTFQYDEGSLVKLAYPSTTATEDGVTCPGAGSILCLATGEAPASAGAPSSNPVAILSVRTTSGWSVAPLPSGVGRLAGTACAGSNRCIGVGFGATGGGGFQGVSVSATPSSSATFTSDTVPAGVTSLSGITCPAGDTCFAWGSGPSGAVILSGNVSSGGVTWTNDTGLTGVSAVSGMACPSASTCFAVGSTSLGATIMSLDSTGTNWVADTLPSGVTVSALTQVVCPGTSTCYAIGAGTSGPLVLSLGLGTAWVDDTLGAAATSFSQVVCPGTSTCYVIGANSSSGVILSVDSSGTNWVGDSLPSTTSLSQVVCPSTSTCVAIGSGSAGPLVLSLSSATSWVSDTVTLPSGVSLTALSRIACAGSSNCFVTGSTSANALILSLGSGTSWADDTLPTAASPVFFSGVACTGSTCEAAGGSKTGAVLLDGTSSGTTWSNGTPNGLAGMYLSDVPVSVSNSSLQPYSTVEVTAPSSDAAQIGPLFPFASGYSVAAGECTAEVAAASSQVSSVPGGTSSAVLPMGLLPVEVVTANGTPVAGATLSATINDSSCTPLTPLSGSNPASFALQPTGPDGLSRLATVYETYTITATAGALSGSITAQVTPTSTIVGGTPWPLPMPVVVTVR